MLEDQPTSITCEDSDGNQYTVFQRQAYQPGCAPADELQQPVWFLIRNGEEVRVLFDKDEETGKQCFTCPDGLKLFERV